MLENLRNVAAEVSLVESSEESFSDVIHQFCLGFNCSAGPTTKDLNPVLNLDRWQEIGIVAISRPLCVVLYLGWLQVLLFLNLFVVADLRFLIFFVVADLLLCTFLCKGGLLGNLLVGACEAAAMSVWGMCFSTACIEGEVKRVFELFS